MAGHLHGVRGRTGTRVDQNPGGPHRPARLRVGGVFRPTQTYRRVEEDRAPGITPRPGDGCLGDFTLPLEQSNPGRAQATGPNPGAGRLPVPAVLPAPGTRRLWKQGVRPQTPDPASRPGTGADPDETNLGHPECREGHPGPFSGNLERFPGIPWTCIWMPAGRGPERQRPAHRVETKKGRAGTPMGSTPKRRPSP